MMYFCNETETELITGLNYEKIKFSPTLDTPPGIALCKLIVQMDEIPTITNETEF